VADTRLALEAGRHVLVEKPIARTLEEAEEMIAAAARAGLALMVGEQFHFMPAFRRVEALLAGGALGDLREIHLVARGFRRHGGWRLRADSVGGGTLIDGGIHYVHNLRWWGRGVRRLFALRPPQTVAEVAGEDAVSLLAELEGGAVGFLSNSLGSPGLPKFQWSSVTGSRASCFADNRGRAVLLRGPGRPRLWLFRRDVRGYEAMLKAFLEAMARGRATEMDGAAGRADLAVVLAAYRSIAERRPVEVAAAGEPC
jgi:predicted dehydrogenase